MLKIAYTGMAYPCLSVPSLCHLGIAVTSEVSIANAIIQIYGTSNYEQDMKIPDRYDDPNIDRDLARCFS